MSAIRTLQKIVETFGVVNEGTALLLSLLDVQSKNIFEMLLYPQDLLSFRAAAFDALVSKIHVQNLTIPFPSFEYDTANEEKYIKGIIYPEEVTITCVENELGILRNWLNSWIKDIAFPMGDLNMASEAAVRSVKGGWVFRDDQQISKKNAMIILQMGSGLPSTGWVKMEGLKLKSTGDLEIGHGIGDPMMIDITCAVDNVHWMTLL